MQVWVRLRSLPGWGSFTLAVGTLAGINLAGGDAEVNESFSP